VTDSERRKDDGNGAEQQYWQLCCSLRFVWRVYLQYLKTHIDIAPEQWTPGVY
jgi:hypothetical protein